MCLRLNGTLWRVDTDIVSVFLIAPFFPAPLDVRFSDLVPGQPFANAFRIAQVAALPDPAPQRSLTFAEPLRVFVDLYLAVSHASS
jgi:hypothetical protein